jgi:PKD repeat protein
VAPTASFTVSPTEPEVGETVTFDASASTDSDGSIASYEWDVDGDGTTDATGQTNTTSYDAAGDYDVTLTVTDDEGATGTSSQTVSVGDVSPPDEDGTVVSLQPADELVGVDGSATYDVVVENANGGVGGATFTVELADASMASITDVQVAGTTENTFTDVQFAGDNSSVTVETAITDTADSGSVTIGTVTVTGTQDGTTAVDLTVSTLGDESGTPYNVTDVTDASLTVSSIVVGDDPAQDLDGDGLYEDVNGDGSVDVLDLQLLWIERNSDTVTSNADAFDFNGDGEFDLLDIVALWSQEIA